MERTDASSSTSSPSHVFEAATLEEFLISLTKLFIRVVVKKLVMPDANALRQEETAREEKEK